MLLFAIRGWGPMFGGVISEVLFFMYVIVVVIFGVKTSAELAQKGQAGLISFSKCVITSCFWPIIIIAVLAWARIVMRDSENTN